MIEAMRGLSLDYLVQALGSAEDRLDPETWYERFRRESPEALFPYLTEDVGTIEKVYAIHREGEVAAVQVQEMRPEILRYLPFVKPSGSQSPQIGPVIKRNYSRAKGASPSRKILNSTTKAFAEQALSKKPWGAYFAGITEILETPMVRLVDESLVDWRGAGHESLLGCVVENIGPTPGTMIVAVKDRNGRWPGESKEYLDYLMEEKLAGDRYLIGAVKAMEGASCPLCGRQGVVIYPNALKGSGLNFLNMDRLGVFPNLDIAQAWKSYSLCVSCADLLYVYKNHVIKKGGPKNDRRHFVTRIGGEKALVVPFTTMSAGARPGLVRKIHRYTDNLSDDVEADEDNLLDLFKDERAILNLTFLWAEIGQNIENVSGVITDVPPSRLRELSAFNAAAEAWQHQLFPGVFLSGMRPDLSLRALSSLFYRPGGKKAQSANKSKRILELKRMIATCVYHKSRIPIEYFWREVHETAKWWWMDALTRGDAYGLLHEGVGKKGPYLTAAGWTRHLCWWLHYFKMLEVMPMERDVFEPEMAGLKPYFGPESAINSREKAYAFLLGVLYGKLIEIQGARKINVGSNALTWLKRLTLKGQDLPELYLKIRGKLLSYESEKSARIRELITEIGNLGARLPEPITLSQTQACYYLLLGQSLTGAILKKNDTEKDRALKGGENDGR